MDKMSEFKEKYPDIYASILEEGRTEGHTKGYTDGMEAGAAKGKAEGLSMGAETERNRIKAVEDQFIPGHEALIHEVKFDGETTGPEAAVKILAAEKKLRVDVIADHQTDAPKPLSQPAQDIVVDGAEPKNVSVKESCEAKWAKDDELREEFMDDFDSYMAYEKAMAQGRVRIIGARRTQ